MLSSSYHNPYDPLRRSELVPERVRGARLALKIGVGVLGGLVLATAVSLDLKDRGSVDRRALNGAPPQVVTIPQTPWGATPHREGREGSDSH